MAMKNTQRREERRVNLALVTALAWIGFGCAVGYLVFTVGAVDPDVAVAAFPIAVSAAVVVTPLTLAALTFSAPRLPWFWLGTVSALAGGVFVVVCLLIAAVVL